jgi:hypothetical protein
MKGYYSISSPADSEADAKVSCDTLYITTRKDLMNLEDFPAVLLCGNCSSYIDDGIKEIFALVNVS